MLNLIEIYRSIQGETSLSGIPTTFIRTAACNLRCSWCDTPYSFGRGEPTPLLKVLDQVEKFGCKHVCITGGEPLLHKNVLSLMSSLCDMGYVVSLETGGSLPTQEVDPRVIIILDVKCPGSGMSDRNYFENLKHLKHEDEVKFVILDEADFDYAVSICKQYKLFDREKSVLFSPVHGELHPEKLIEWVLRDQHPVRLNLQIHKYIWEPDLQGV